MIKEEIKVQIIKAEEGKVFQRVSDGELVGSVVAIGSQDSVDNYIEIIKEEKEHESEQMEE